MFGFTYSHAGRGFSISVDAATREEAEARVSAMGRAEFVGRLVSCATETNGCGASKLETPSPAGGAS